MRLLLISNSTNAGEAYLEHPLEKIGTFLGTEKIRAVFIPYAGVTISFEDYTERVRARFREIGHDVRSVHESEDPRKEIRRAGAIVVGGGNTFQLTRMIKDRGLMETIRGKVLEGTPYIGWSAGSNLACPTIRTTNDMPIVETYGFGALNLVPFQINPHYLDANPEGHAGETREMRIEEFIEANPGVYVLGLREGSMLHVEGKSMELLGPKPARLFRKGLRPRELTRDDNLSFLL